MDWSRPHPYDPALSEAIGLVAYESAVLDDVLRQAIDELFYDDSYTWILLEGQSTEWLIDTTKTLSNTLTTGCRSLARRAMKPLCACSTKPGRFPPCVTR